MERTKRPKTPTPKTPTTPTTPKTPPAGELLRTLAALDDPEAVPDGDLALPVEDLPRLPEGLPRLPDVEPVPPTWATLGHWLGRDSEDVYQRTSSRAVLLYLAEQAAKVDPAVRRELAALAELQRAAGGDTTPEDAAYCAGLIQELLADKISPADAAGFTDELAALDGIAARWVESGTLDAEDAARIPGLLAEVRAAAAADDEERRTLRAAWQERIRTRIRKDLPPTAAAAAADLSPQALGGFGSGFYLADTICHLEAALRCAKAAKEAGDLARWGGDVVL